MATEINLKLIYDTIANIEADLTDSKIAIATDTNAYGYEPFAWGAGSEIYYAAALDENAQFGNLRATGDIWVTNTIHSYNDDDLKMEFNPATPSIRFGVGGLTKMYCDDVLVKLSGETQIDSAEELNLLNLKYQGPADVNPIELVFDKTEEPDNYDDLGSIIFRSANNNSEVIDYATIYCKISAKTDGAERGELYLNSDIVGIGNGQIEITPLSITLNDVTYISTADSLETLILDYSGNSTDGTSLDIYNSYNAPSSNSLIGRYKFTQKISGDDFELGTIGCRLNSVTHDQETATLELRSKYLHIMDFSDIVGVINTNNDGQVGFFVDPDAGWGSKFAIEGQFHVSHEKFSISSLAPYVAQMVGDVVMTSEADWKFTKDSLFYPPIIVQMGRGNFVISRGITGHKDDTFNIANLTHPLIMVPGSINMNENVVSISDGSDLELHCQNGNVGIGMAPTEKLCIKFPEHEILFYDCIHSAESTPATTSMYLMYKIGTSLYKIPCYGAD
jgi:hypothetical protein